MDEIKGRILVIDDEAGIREGCRRTLEREGYGVETAASSQDGLALLIEKNFDLVLLDVVLPDIRGVELLGSILKRDVDIVCIVITGFATVELAVQTIKAGAYDFLAKPFTPDLLLLSVSQGMERRRLTLQSKQLLMLREESEQVARAHNELKQLTRFKTAYTLTVAHELRAPVAAVQSFLTTLVKGYVSPAEQHAMLKRALERTQDLLNLVDDLLNLAAAQQEKPTTPARVLSPSEVLDKILPVLKIQADSKKLAMTVEIRQRPLVKAQPDQMGQLWTNLISNAIKYTPSNGRVRIALEQEEGWAVGQVEDTGIGISKEDLPWIFDEFYRTSQAKQVEPRGTGLGLALVKQIVERCGGSLDVESTCGKGTRFTFRIPAVALDPVGVEGVQPV